MKNDDQLVGVGGWLRFLIGLLYIGGGFSLLVSLSGSTWKSIEEQNPSLLTHTAFQNLQMMDRGVQFFVGVLLIYCGYALSKKTVPETLTLAKIIIGLVLPISIIFRDLVAPYFFLGISLVEDAVVGEVVRTIIWSAVWSLYLYRSKRVRNTYTNAF